MSIPDLGREAASRGLGGAVWAERWRVCGREASMWYGKWTGSMHLRGRTTSPIRAEPCERTTD